MNFKELDIEMENELGITLAYPASFTDEDGELIVTFRDIPEALTSGQNEEDAIEEACDALKVAIAGYLKEGKSIPRPSNVARGEHLIPVSPSLAAKAFLSDAMRAKEMTQVDLAVEMGVEPKQVQRILNPDHASTLASLSKALGAVGLSVTMTLVDVSENRRMLRASGKPANDPYVLHPMKAVRGRPALREKA